MDTQICMIESTDCYIPLPIVPIVYIIQAGSSLRLHPAIPESAIFHHNCVHVA